MDFHERLREPSKTRWWFQRKNIFTSKIGEDFQFDSYFSDGLKPPTRKCPCFSPLRKEFVGRHGVLINSLTLRRATRSLSASAWAMARRRVRGPRLTDPSIHVGRYAIVMVGVILVFINNPRTSKYEVRLQPASMSCFQWSLYIYLISWLHLIILQWS